MKKEDAAFPVFCGNEHSAAEGMSKRFYAACAAMQGMLSYHGRYWQSAYPEYAHLDGLLPEEAAKLAIQFADELIKQEGTMTKEEIFKLYESGKVGEITDIVMELAKQTAELRAEVDRLKAQVNQYNLIPNDLKKIKTISHETN